MAPTLSDMDNFTLSELDDFTLQELDDMSYDELVRAVQAKCKIADAECNKEAVLSEAQMQAVTEIIHAYMKEHEQTQPSWITTGLTVNAIWWFIGYCATMVASHTTEIINALKQAYLLLEQLIQQMPK